MRALRSGNGRRGSYHRCAARATQAFLGAGGCELELLGWWAPPEHQETQLDATRAARVFSLIGVTPAGRSLVKSSKVK